MWDKIFTASMVAYSVSFVVFLIGHYVLQLHPITMSGIGLMGVTAMAMGVSGFVLVLNTKART